MKNLSLILLFITSPLFSQEFSTTFIFKDALGNKDSIIVGYSPLATDSLNHNLGEIQIPSNLIDTLFGVYISNVTANSVEENCYYEKAKFRTKKKYTKLISKKDVYTWNDDLIIKVDIIAKFFPVTVSWNKTLFQNDSLQNSFIISTRPGFWFDAGEFPNKLSENDSILYYPNGIMFQCYNDSIELSLIPIHKLYICFATKDYLFSISNVQANNVNIYPNPCKSFINIELQIENDFTLEIISPEGKLVNKTKISKKNNIINTSDLPKGVFILRLRNNNEIMINKLFKN